MLWRALRAALIVLPAGLALSRSGAFLERPAHHDHHGSTRHDGGPGSPSHTRPLAVFVAGLEGSGHHLVEAFWRLLEEAPDFNFRQLGLPPKWHCGMKWDQVAGWMEMVRSFGALDARFTYLLPPKASYPCGWGSHASRRDENFPRLDWVSQVAIDTATQLRVLLLYRPIEQILAADCLKRSFEDSCADAAETIEANARHLVEQLTAMKRAHGGHEVKCMVYGDISQMVSSIGEVVSNDTVRINADAAIRSMWSEPTKVDMSRMTPLPAEVVERLTSVDKELLSICMQSQSSGSHAS